MTDKNQETTSDMSWSEVVVLIGTVAVLIIPASFAAAHGAYGWAVVLMLPVLMVRITTGKAAEIAAAARASKDDMSKDSV